MANPLKNKKIVVTCQIVAALILTHLVLESIFFLLVGFGFNLKSQFTISSFPSEHYDLVSGYRCSPTVTRFARSIRGELIFEGRFRGNNRGYVSKRDYDYRKSDSHTRRLVLFGDSFSAGRFLAENWPDRLQDILHEAGARDSTDGDRWEIYSFALDGGGIDNWHSIFFREIVPRYDFDVVMVAASKSNLVKGFTLAHCVGDACFFGQFDSRPESDEDFFANYLPKMNAAYTIHPDIEFEGYLSPGKFRHYWNKPALNFYFTRYFGAKISNQLKRALGKDIQNDISQAAVSGGLLPREKLTEIIPESNLNMFMEILDYCREHGKQVIVCSIPSRTALLELVGNGFESVNEHELALASLAALYDCCYWDGYRVFDDFSADEIVDRYWLKYDGHWNQRGSDLFARRVADLLLRGRFGGFGATDSVMLKQQFGIIR